MKKVYLLKDDGCGMNRYVMQPIGFALSSKEDAIKWLNQNYSYFRSYEIIEIPETEEEIREVLENTLNGTVAQ